MGTAAKLKQAEDGLTQIAKTVLSAVPIAEPWSLEQVKNELVRKKQAIAENSVNLCLQNLRGLGLVSEPKRGMFVRVSDKPKIELVAKAQPAAPGAPTLSPLPLVAEKGAAETIDRLASVAAAMRALAAQAQAAASEIEDVALDVEARVQGIRSDALKLRQLQDLLKSIGQ
jgi:hypothetical protein